jgi:hypothetical protein
MVIVEEPVQFFGVVTVEAEAKRRPGPPTDEPAFQMPLQIQDEIETRGANPAQKGAEGPPPMTPVEKNNLIYGGMMLDERKGRRLDGPSDVGLRVSAPNQIGKGERPSHITDGTVQHDQYPMRIQGHCPNLYYSCIAKCKV